MLIYNYVLCLDIVYMYIKVENKEIPWFIFCLLVKEFSGIINLYTGYKLMITEKSLTNKQYIYIYIL